VVLSDVGTPDLSVIVTVVDGTPALTLCLEALVCQLDPPSMEVIIPYDDTISEVGRLAERFPTIRFLDLGKIYHSKSTKNAFTPHTFFDRRRAAGLRAAKGRLLAMLEDRGRPQPDWARAMVDLHDATSYSAIGGAIENGASGALRWAVYFCDFGRFQPPIAEQDSEYLSDINICYKREALKSVRELWEHEYHEPTVNWALRRMGNHLHLSERPLVIQERSNIGFWSLVKERVHWGRTFGQIRGSETSSLGCALWAAACPLLPVLLFVRHFRRQIHKRRNIAQFVRAIPATVLLLCFWCVGEFVGYCRTAVDVRNRRDRY
jgi:hypothetical protein